MLPEQKNRNVIECDAIPVEPVQTPKKQEKDYRWVLILGLLAIVGFLRFAGFFVAAILMLLRKFPTLILTGLVALGAWQMTRGRIDNKTKR